MVLNKFEDIVNIFYINLEHRVDRREHVINELTTKGLGLSLEYITRFNAIKMIDGAVGCSMSHLKILQDAVTNNLDHILIVEDDITFLEPETLKTQFNKFITNHGTNWDVILLGGNVIEYNTIDETCVKVQKCLTTTGYLVNGHYIQTLVDNIKAGLSYLIKRPLYKNLYAIDVFWFGLQQKHNWYLIIPLTVIQMEDYSDVEKKITNFTKSMTALDKSQRNTTNQIDTTNQRNTTNQIDATNQID